MPTPPPHVIAPPPASPREHEAPAFRPPSVGSHRGRLGTTRSYGRWAFAVSASGALTGAAAATGLPAVLAVALGMAWAVGGITDLVAKLVAQRYERVGRGVTTHQLAMERMLADQFVDAPTHGWLAEAHEALVASRARFARLPTATSGDARAVTSAIAVIHAIEADLRHTRASRLAWTDDAPPSLSGGFAIQAVAEDPDVLIRLYGDPANLPDWLGPRGRDVLARVGAVLDDVRILNTPQTEWAVLLFTLWARALLVGGAPLLAAVSLGEPPLQDGWALRDLPWAIAGTWSILTALAAPWIATAVMLRDDHGSRVRRWLLVVEIPLALVAVLCTPCWPVVVFAVGWTNWWQRPEFDWLRLGAWMIVVGTLLATGMGLHGTDVLDVLVEFVFAMTAIAIVGATYGAMLPVSASLLARTLLGGLLTPRRARNRANVRINDSIRQLLDAARAIERHSPDDPSAARDVSKLRESAQMLGARADAGDRWARRTPLGLETLVDGALGEAGVMSDEPKAVVLLEEAQRSGAPEPVTLDEPAFHQRRLRVARFRRRSDARALRLLVTEVVREARRHGTGPLVTVCRMEGDRVVVRFANAVPPGPPRAGRGNGASNLRRLARSLADGQIDTRGMVEGSFIDLPDLARRFGVQASFDAAALEGIDDHPT